MNILAKIHSISVGGEINSLKASELYEMLDVKSKFNTWIQRRINKNSFVENFDYIKQEIKTDGRPFTEYYVTLDMAKHLCMMENNEIGMTARKYFIKIEKEHREQAQPTLQINNLTNKISLMQGIIDDLMEKNSTLQLAPPKEKNIEFYRKELEDHKRIIDEKDELISHFSLMAGTQVQKTVNLKNVPKIIKKHRGQYLDAPKLYLSLSNLIEELEREIREKVA